ncbi:MAG: hypothetical protein AAB309_03375 [Deltaproteobacteria bacterium]
MKYHVILRAQPEGSRLFFLFFIFLFILSSCSPRPQPTSISDKPLGDEVVGKSGGVSALWLATTDFQTAGLLRRLDLKTGELKDLLPVGTDVRIFRDGDSRLFLLTSIQNDSIHLLEWVEGAEAKVVSERALAPRVNPQAVTRDAEGRIWLVSLDSNEVQIFTANLKNEIATIDLSFLKDDGDPYAELSSILFAAPNRIVVSAARLQRGEAWLPSAESRLAVIDTETFGVVASPFVDVSNPLHLYLTRPQNILVVGSGDLSLKRSLFGRWLNLSTVSLTSSDQTTLSSRILDSSLCEDQKLAFIEWIPEEEKSCIRVGEQKLLCEQGNGGFIFNKLTCAGDLLFASYIKEGNAELWVIPRDGSQTKRIPMKQQIQSMSPGP